MTRSNPKMTRMMKKSYVSPVISVHTVAPASMLCESTGGAADGLGQTNMPKEMDVLDDETGAAAGAKGRGLW